MVVRWTSLYTDVSIELLTTIQLKGVMFSSLYSDYVVHWLLCVCFLLCYEFAEKACVTNFRELRNKLKFDSLG